MIVNNEAKELTTTIKYKNNKLNIFSNNLKTKLKLTSNNSGIIYIKGSGSIYEANGNINLNNNNEIKKIEKVWKKTIKNNTEKLLTNIKENYQSDIFGFGNMIYKNYPKKWKKIKTNWNNIYFKKFKIKVYVNTKIISTGSLTKTLEEGEK